jgi:putative FmdB family regulatory protein
MPTYAYQCQACGTSFEQYQKFDDAPITKCPNCKKNKVRRVVAPAAIVFKGSGWYKTDSRSNSPTTPKGKHTAGDKPAETTPAADKPSENGSSNGKDAKPKAEKAAASDD